MDAANQNASGPNKWVVVALFGIILWYWLPHFTIEDNPENAKPAGSITMPAVEPPAAESPAIPEAALTEVQPEPVEEVSPKPEEVLAESQPESPESVPIDDPAPSNSQTSAQPTATSATSSEGTAIAGRVKDIWSLIDWLQQQGGAMWLDDGYQTPGNIYELAHNGSMVSVSSQQYQDARSRYAPRGMSSSNHRQVAQSLGYAVSSKRLLLMWPRRIWLDIQNRIDRLGADQIQLEYQIAGGELELYVVEALREGTPMPELQGLLP